jgi:HrpA-like RNA helicase
MKVIVTSATLDKDKFSKYFMNAPVLQIPGRLYPVEIEYSQQKLSPTSNYLDEVIKKALQIHQSTRSDSGDILCFLTGQDEVIKAREKCATLIQKQKFSPAISLSLYGKQLPEEQNLVFEKSPPNTRKIVFATDVAETGLTIDGIRHVVDCGLCKESTYDPIRNVTVLSVQRICQSSAIQRAGRAGRTAPGACYRLYTEDDYEEMNPSQTPEILSNPLQLTVTNLMTMGIDATSFDWIEAPDRDALDCAKKDLTYLGAMEQTQGSRLELTTLGYLISNLQIDPGMARMMYYACLEGYGVAASTIVGLMSVSSNFYYRGTSNNPNDQMAAADKHQQFCHPLGDVVSMFQAYSRWEELMLSYQQARGDDVMGDLTGEGEEKDDGNGGDLDEDLNDLMMELSFDQPPPPPPADLPLEDDVEEDEEQADGMEFKNDLETPPQQQPDDGEFLEETNISEIDDNSSVSSATSSAFTEMSTVTKEEEFKISKFAASKLAKKFCAENYLNGKSLSMAQSTKLDVIRNLKTFQASSLWSAHATQEKQPTPEIIQRLVLKGLFLNVSVQTFIPRGYEVLRNTIPTIGILSPGSSLVKASRSNEVTNLPQTPNDSSLFPQYVVYNTMMTTSRTFLNTVTPIEIDWILEECPLFHSEVIAPRLATCRCRRIEITDVKPDLIPGLFGKFQDKKRSLESLLNITLQYDGRSLLEVWCAQDQERLVEEIIREKLATLRRNGLEEIEEEIYVGKTRVVYGPGCVVETLLFEYEFISIGFSLKGEVGEEIIRPLVARFGTLHLIESYFLVQEKKLEKEKRTGFRIYYKRKEDAKCAHNALNGEVINGEIISVSPGGIRSTSLHADTSSQLVMSWSCSPSTGNGFLDFPTHEAAMAVLGLSDQGSNCPHLVALGSSVKLSLWKSKPGQPSSTRLGIRGLYPHVDEYDLEAACMALSRSRHITIPFRVMINRGGDAASEQQPLLVEIAHLRSLIPLRHKVVTETSFFDHVHKGRAGLFIHHTEDDIATAIDIWRNNSFPIMWNGQPVRLFGEFKKKITIHVEVKKYFEGELNQLLTSLAQRNSVRSRWISSKATEAKKDQKICLTLTSSNLATLNSAMAQINDIIKFQIYTPTDPKGKELLFSHLGRKRLTEISNVAYLHWDNKLKIIKIFGTNEKIKAATKSLDEALSRLGELQKKEIFEIQRRKRKDVISAWHQLKGVLKETIATFQVGVHQIDVMGSAEALVELREWLAQRNFLVTKSADRRHAPHCPLDCDICGDVAENPTFYYRGCGHGGCQSCLANQFSQSEITLPVVCPFDRQLLAISDINVLATAEAMKQYKTAALHKYVRENSNKVQCCPSPCCTQILQLPSSLVIPNEQEEIRSGGRVVAYCDECNMNYCLTCSQRDGKAVAAHPRYLCRETVEDCNDVTRVSHQLLCSAHAHSLIASLHLTHSSSNTSLITSSPSTAQSVRWHSLISQDAVQSPVTVELISVGFAYPPNPPVVTAIVT